MWRRGAFIIKGVFAIHRNAGVRLKKTKILRIVLFVLIAATLTLILIPYGWGFDRTAPSTQATPEQTEAVPPDLS